MKYNDITKKDLIAEYKSNAYGVRYILHIWQKNKDWAHPNVYAIHQVGNDGELHTGIYLSQCVSKIDANKKFDEYLAKKLYIHA